MRKSNMTHHNVTLLIVILLIVLLFGGFGYSYRAGDAYPYRTYAGPGLGVIVVVLLVLYFVGII
jgi:hypothetical protein